MREEHRLRVFESRVLKKIFGPKRDEVTGHWRRLHNEKLYDTYPSPNIIWVITLRIMKQNGHKVRIGFWSGDLRELFYLEDLGVEGRIILKLVFKQWNGEAWTELVWL